MNKLIILLISQLSISTFAKDLMSPSRLDKLSGESTLPFDNKTKWDKRYNKRTFVYGKAPAKFLAENFDYLKPESQILDMGMGEGRNAVFLAQKGHLVTGIDISSVAIKKAKRLGNERGVKFKTITGSLKKYKIPLNSYDAIICFYYVDRSLNKKIMGWLKPGGILIYEAHTIKELQAKNSEDEKESYYLKEQELLTMFSNAKILKYEEPLHEREFRSSIIVQKAF